MMWCIRWEQLPAFQPQIPGTSALLQSPYLIWSIQSSASRCSATFIPKALACLRENPQVRYVLFVEDDCRMLAGTRVPHLLAVAREARGRTAWLGYSFRHGEPKVGAHLVCFSRVSLSHFRAYAEEADPLGRLVFDTVLHAMWTRGRVWAPAAPLAYQERHALQGRQ